MTALVAMKAARAIATETKFLANGFFTFVIVLVLLLVIDLLRNAFEHDHEHDYDE